MADRDLYCLIESWYIELTFQQQKVQVGDGTIVSRSMHVLVIAFILVNVKSEECPNSLKGNHVVALIDTT